LSKVLLVRRLLFTYSIHMGKNYPAQKQPGDLDVELPRWSWGKIYLAELERTLPVVIDSLTLSVDELSHKIFFTLALGSCFLASRVHFPRRDRAETKIL
jgi:hypothetical protein